MTSGGVRADENGCAARPRAGVAGCEPICAAAPTAAHTSAAMLRAMTTANFTREISGAIEPLCRKITAMVRTWSATVEAILQNDDLSSRKGVCVSETSD